MPKKKNNITKEQAIEELWRRGELTWLLTDVQKDMKERIYNDKTRTSVVVVSRRTGKTFLLVTMALEQCIKKPNSIVKFLLPKQKDVKTIIKPLLREITQTCPPDLIPKFNTQDKTYTFDNGSEIHLAGADLSAESLRGTRADLVIIDEAGFVNDLLYTIRSILSPTIRTTRGRMIMASTPSRDPQHEFIQHYMNPYKAAGRLKIYDIYDNPNFNEEIIQEIIEEYPLGIKDPDFRREYMCEVLIDEESAICPEYAEHKDNIIIEDYEIPEYRDFYVGADIGFRDLTVMLFGFYNFKEGCLYITDELVMHGPKMTTEKLAEEIKHKEKINFFCNGKQEEAYLRVMDVDLKLINDLQQLHGLTFIPTKKDNKDGAINQMRMWISQGKLKIHKKCKHLQYHLEFGQWNKHRTDFLRLQDTPDKEIRGGHVDAIPALYYLIRNVQQGRNPFPFGFGLSITKDTFMSPKFKNKSSQAAEMMKKMLNIKGSKKK